MLKDERFESQIILKVLGAHSPKGLSRRAKIGYGHLCLIHHKELEIKKIKNNNINSFRRP
jgi:hypothetical protein